jgi:hypothetical protein
MWYPAFTKIAIPILLPMVRTFVYSPEAYRSSSWEPTEVVGQKMDAVARKFVLKFCMQNILSVL